MQDRPTHTLFEDAQGLLVGTSLCGIGVHVLSSSGLITGQMAGLAVLLTYATGLGFGVVFFAINLPFYWLAYRHLGRAFTVKTFISVALVSVFTEAAKRLIEVTPAHPAIAAIVFGTMAGAGLLAIFRHRASLGGVGILGFYLQEKMGMRAGWVQLAFDVALFAVALLLLAPDMVLWSLLGAAILNVIIGVNHRRDRYIAT